MTNKPPLYIFAQHILKFRVFVLGNIEESNDPRRWTNLGDTPAPLPNSSRTTRRSPALVTKLAEAAGSGDLKEWAHKSQSPRSVAHIYFLGVL